MASISYLNTFASAANSASYTDSGASLGAADANRWIVVVATGRGGGNAVSSITVAGNSCTLITDSLNSIGIGFVQVPTGTTGDIVVTFSGAMSNCTFGYYRVVTTETLTSFDIASGDLSSSSDPSASLDVPDGGAIFAVALKESGSSSDDASGTWTGATEDAETETETGSTSNSYSAASENGLSSEIGRTVQRDWNNAASVRKVVLAVSFQVDAQLSGGLFWGFMNG